MRVTEDDNVIQYQPKKLPTTIPSSRELIQLYTQDLERRGDGIKRFKNSGFGDLDLQIGPWLHEGHLVIVGGRPGMGKSIFGQQVAENLAGDYTSIYFSLEMSAHELIERSISRRSSIPVKILKAYTQPNDLSELQWKRFSKATGEVTQLKMFVDEDTYMLEDIILTAKKASHELEAQGQPRIGLIIVDYLQLIETNVNRQSNRTLAVGEVSRALKRLAKDLSIPIIALCQLSRGLESRPDKRPLLSDLRESGSLEQDADIVLMIYRDDVYDPETNEPGIAEIITRKNRHGPNNITVKLPFSGKRMAFGNNFHTQTEAEVDYSELVPSAPDHVLEDIDDNW